MGVGGAADARHLASELAQLRQEGRQLRQEARRVQDRLRRRAQGRRQRPLLDEAAAILGAPSGPEGARGQAVGGLCRLVGKRPRPSAASGAQGPDPDESLTLRAGLPPAPSAWARSTAAECQRQDRLRRWVLSLNESTGLAPSASQIWSAYLGLRAGATTAAAGTRRRIAPGAVPRRALYVIFPGTG